MNSTSNKKNPVVIIMAKVPRSGQVKTRLRPILSDSQCVEIATCFLLDTVLKAKKITENVIVAFSPGEARNEIKQLLPESINLIEQIGDNLGERMQSAIEFAENKEFSPIIVIGTDSPTFPTYYLKQSINLLENNQEEVVIGATEDGGYYLIGLKKSVKGIFENVQWSSEKTFLQTAENAQRIFGSKPVQIPGWYDVDTSDDLKFLIEESLENEDFSSFAPKTSEWLLTLGDLFSPDFKDFGSS